jgi:outer membrane protein assembly factor BamB
MAKEGMNCPLPTLVFLFASLTGCVGLAADWPQWRGPQRNGTSPETNWLNAWPKDGAPRVAWRFPAGKGHSAVSVADGRAFTMGWDGTQDWVFCLEASSGRLIWKQSYPCGDIVQWSGPRATPTVEGDAVYTLGQHGRLRAWSARDGEPLWEIQLGKDYEPDVDYGFTWSPLIVGDHLILSAGTRGLALDKRTGRFVWGHDRGRGACASPVPFPWNGRTGVAVITTAADRDSVTLTGVDPVNGAVIWQSPPWREKWGASCVDLLVDGGRVFVTSAEQYVRCARFTVQGAALEEDWAHTRLASYTGGCVLVDGHLFGITKAGLLKCLDWQTGEEHWAQRGFGGHGSLIAAGGKLLLQASDRGELMVADAVPAGYRELRRFKVFAGEPATFTAPSLAQGRIHCRSYAGEVVCLDLSGE